MKGTYEKLKNTPFSIVLNRTLIHNQMQINHQNNNNNNNVSSQNDINLNANNDLDQNLDNKNLFLNKKRVLNNEESSNHLNIFDIQNNAIYLNIEKEKEEKQTRIKARKAEKKSKELYAIETKKTNAKESLDMAFGFSNNPGKMNIGLNENYENKKVSDDEVDSSDLSSE